VDIAGQLLCEGDRYLISFFLSFMGHSSKLYLAIWTGGAPEHQGTQPSGSSEKDAFSSQEEWAQAAFLVCGGQGDYMGATQERKKERANVRVKREMMAKS